ncbi:MAG: M15 family metallopeptidase [Oscillospiraceae bacterium]|jgi:D-alanyl-D-alanine carboxypeptidase|nr:M15 family metallopeptidase [Oscillospiraceae bacterium]
MNYYERHRKQMQAEETRTRKMRKSANRASIFVCCAGMIIIALMGANSPVHSKDGGSSASAAASTLSASRPQQSSALVLTENAKKALASDWHLMLINRQHKLPADFAVTLYRRGDGFRVDKRIEPQLEQMISAAQTAGIQLVLSSGYRSISEQQKLYHAESFAPGAPVSVQPAGYSEHHTGLAVDIVTPSYRSLNAGFAGTAAAKWLSSNAWKYGFIQRYQKEKESVTGVIYEPWHYRYVGTEYAEKMQHSGMCLEEYRRALGI